MIRPDWNSELNLYTATDYDAPEEVIPYADPDAADPNEDEEESGEESTTTNTTTSSNSVDAVTLMQEIKERFNFFK